MEWKRLVWQERFAIAGTTRRLVARRGSELTETAHAEAGVYAVFAYDGEREGPDAFAERLYEEWPADSMYAPRDFYIAAQAGGDGGTNRAEPAEATNELWVPVVCTRPPHNGSYRTTWTTAAQALREAIKFTDKRDISLVDVMGYTGHAFRINICEGNVDVAGPTAWEWGPVLRDGLLRLGIRASYLGAPNFTPPGPELLGQAIEKAQRSIDRGVPAIAWDLLVPEFGVLSGYDDDRQTFRAIDVSGDGELPYAKLGRGQIGELFVLTLDEFFTPDKRRALADTLRDIVDHAYNRYHLHPEPPYQNGLAGYDAWIAAFEGGAVDPFGNAYNAALVCDARAFAARFLQELAERWDGESPAGREIARLAGQAAVHYRAVFDALARLLPLYPFPQGGNPEVAANAQYSIAALQRAKAEEERGVGLLADMLRRLED